MESETVTDNCALQPDGLAEALKLVAKHFMRDRGRFAYEAFEFINAKYFGNALPYPLIVWALTAHGGCLGLTYVHSGEQPVILLHPSTLQGTEKSDPWGIDPRMLGWCFAFDVLVHECIHVHIGWREGGWTNFRSSHNNPLWVAHVNRLAPLLGLPAIRAAMTKVRRVAVEGKLGPRGKPPTKVQRGTDGDIPFGAVKTFPRGVRVHLGLTDFYLKQELPFAFQPNGNGKCYS
jgi:hypothetical protein